ncbi:hypothetical protein ACFVH0_13755 [Streptomyces sp. NPDC127117]|uniref:hypothetical protein n=1 Tax=Streptomyces sp. NPDC127117 TaxID=3345368 RepID=UPI0036273F7A
MLVRTEAVRQVPSEPVTTVRVRSAVGTAVVPWRSAPEDVGREHHVEWTVDEDIVPAENTLSAASGPPKFREDGDHIVFRGRPSPTGDGTALLGVGGELLLFELAVPPPPGIVDAAWVEVRVGQENVTLWPYRL